MTNLAHLAKIRPDSDLRSLGTYVQLPKEFFLELERFLFSVHGDWKVANAIAADTKKREPFPQERELGSLLTCLQNHGRNSGVY